MDNGFAAVEDPVAVQAICEGLSPAKIDRLLRRWLAILPHPFTRADRAAGYHLAPLLGIDPATMTPGRMSYELRRIRLHGLIARIPDPPLPRRLRQALVRLNTEIDRAAVAHA